MSREAEVGDWVQFTEPGFPLTGESGEVLSVRPFALTVRFFKDDKVSTWRREFFTLLTREQLECGAV